MRYHVTPTTTGALHVIRGRYMLVYPRSRFTPGIGRWGAWNLGGEVVIHLGFFGLTFGRVIQTERAAKSAKKKVERAAESAPRAVEETLPGFTEPSHPPQTTTALG